MTILTSSAYRIKIPKSVRSKLNLEPGQRFRMSEEGGVIILTPIPPDPSDFLCGIFKGEPSMTQQLVNEEKRDLRHE